MSRQVNPVSDTAGVSVSKVMIQQQMRNTHFGDGGFGFAGKIKHDLSLDSERKISRKRGMQKAPYNNLEDSAVRGSKSGASDYQKVPKEKA